MLLFGYVAWTLATAALSSSVDSISTELKKGTFYRKLQSRCSIIVLLFAELVASVLIELIVIAVLLVISRAIFGVHLTVTAAGVVSILISTVGMFGIGLIMGGLTILFKRIGAVTLLLELGLLLATDTIPTNTTVLLFTRIVPLTSCNAVIKNSLVGASCAEDLLFLTASSALWVLFGSFVLKRCIRSARKKGNLLFY
jgi:ABC-2 type transport system permease protein